MARVAGVSPCCYSLRSAPWGRLHNVPQHVDRSQTVRSRQADPVSNGDTLARIQEAVRKSFNSGERQHRTHSCRRTAVPVEEDIPPCKGSGQALEQGQRVGTVITELLHKGESSRRPPNHRRGVGGARLFCRQATSSLTDVGAGQVPSNLTASLNSSPSERKWAVVPSIDFQEHQQIRLLCGGQLRRNRGRRRKPGPPRPQPVQREDLLEGLGLAAVQVRRVIVDAEQRRRVKASRPKRRAGGGVVADFQRIVDIERPHISRYLKTRSLQVKALNSLFARSTPGSKGGPFWATAAGLSRWKIWLFVHLAPPWQEAQFVLEDHPARPPHRWAAAAAAPAQRKRSTRSARRGPRWPPG